MNGSLTSDKPQVWITRRKNPSGKRSHTVRWIIDGKCRSKACGSDRERANEFRRQKLKALHEGIDDELHPVTWGAFVDKFMAMYRLENAASSCVDMQHALDQFAEACGPAGPHSVTYNMVQEFRQALTQPSKELDAKGRPKRRAVKPITINKKVKALRTAIREAKRMRHTDRVPDFKLFETPEPTPDPFTPEQRKTLFESLPDAKWKAFAELGFTTSARKMDIVALQWEHIDFEGRCLLIREKKRQRLDPRPRWAAMTDDAYTYLRELFEATPKRVVNGQYVPRIPWVFTTPAGKQWKWNINRQWGKLLEKAGIARHTVHDMRKTAPSDMERWGYGEKTKQSVTGHKSGQVMRDHYIRVDQDQIREAAERVSQEKRRA